MFTGFERQIRKVKAHILNETFIEETANQRVGHPDRIARRNKTTALLKQELAGELSRPDNYGDSIIINPKAHEKILSKNDCEKEARTLGGSFGSRLTKLKDDGYGVFKPYEEFEFHERKMQIGNERAAYLLDLFLGLDLVPPTVIRELKYSNNDFDHVGSMQQYIEGAKVGLNIKDSGKDDVDPSEIAKLAIFDFIIKNTDRHPGNYLVKNNKIYAIDHGLCFAARVTGYRSDEDDTPKGILSSDYYEPLHRSTLFNRQTFWDLQLPPENRERMKAFNDSPKEKSIFHELLKENLGKEKADLFLHRITSVITAIDADGKLNQKILKEALDDVLNKHYPQEKVINN